MMDYGQLFSLTFWQEVFSTNPLSVHFLVSILDILIVWFLVYKLIQMLKGTRAVMLARGVVLFFVIRVIADVIGLTTISWLMNQIITYGVIAAIIIFQPEARKALEQLGQTVNFKSEKDNLDEVEKIIEGYEKAVAYMSKRKIGALISIEKTQSLDEYISTGIPVHADITGELLINIFIPNTPLHDGAVIVKNHQVAVACAYLPLTENSSVPKEFGTRHRAAIGLSEVTDALTIIVSEETGGISITKNSEFLNDLSMEQLGKILRVELVEAPEEKKNLLQTLDSKFIRRKKDE